MRDIAVAMLHPIGQELHIPIGELKAPDNMKARTTRSIRSVNVAIMNFFIALEPRSIPSAVSLVDTTK